MEYKFIENFITKYTISSVNAQVLQQNNRYYTELQYMSL